MTTEQAFLEGIKAKPDIKKYIYNNDCWFFDDDLLSAFFDAGYYDHPKPYRSRGWRYGWNENMRKSFNHRDQIPEPGISMMQVDGEAVLAPKDSIYIALNEFDKRPVVWLKGWVLGVRGSDGESLMVSAKKIEY